MAKATIFTIFLSLLLTKYAAAGQAGNATPSPEVRASQPSPASTASYILGSDDQIVIRAFQVEEISERPIQIGPDGLISLPMVGTVQASGLTVRELEREITARLAAYVQQPAVSILVTEYRSQPVSVLGEVNNAGVHRLRGETNLLEILSLAGGMRQDASYRIKMVRRIEWGQIPLPGATLDQTGKFSLAELNVKDVLETRRPEDNIPIKPYDVITVPKADMVYVIGEVNKPGAFILNDRATMSVLQAVSRAEGLKALAKANKARVLRAIPGKTEKQEINVNVSGILRGSVPDMPLRPDDVLFVPNNASKAWTARGIDALIGVGTGIAIWRPL